MFRKLIPLFLAAVLILTGCAAAASPVYDRAEEQSYSKAAPSAGAPAYETNRAASVVPQETIERIVLKNASISVSAADPEALMASIARLAEGYGGFVVSSNLYQVTLDNGVQVPEASISVRVPADQFTVMLDEIASQATQVLSRNETGQDVTSQYTDLQSRLRNLQVTEAQLVKIMEEANKTEDVLSVLNQLTYIREQIEVIQGQIKYYDQSAAFSLIDVEIKADEAVQPLSIGGWKPVGVARDALQALLDTVQFLVNALIWIVIFVLPAALLFFFIILLPLRWGWRGLRKLWRRFSPPKEPKIKPVEENPQAQN